MDVLEAHADTPTPSSQAGVDIPASGGELVRLNTLEAVCVASPAKCRPSAPTVHQTKEAGTRHQMDGPMKGKGTVKGLCGSETKRRLGGGRSSIAVMHLPSEVIVRIVSRCCVPRPQGGMGGSP